MRLAPLLALLLLAPPALAHDGADDCGSGGDAAFNVFAGPVLLAPTDCVAHLGGSDDGRDSFRVEAPPGTRLRVEIVPADENAIVNVWLFSPDHNGNGGSRAIDRNELHERHVEANSTEPGLWGFFVYIQNGTRILHTDYRVVVTLEGEPWAPDEHEGAFLAGSPLGSRLGRAAGPDAPAEADGIDGDWIALNATTAGRDFFQVTTDACDECILVSYRLTSGSTLDATCERKGAVTSCIPFAGITHVLVHGVEGVDVAFTLQHWHP